MDVLDQMVACCEAWEPQACVMENVRAGEAARALRDLRAALAAIKRIRVKLGSHHGPTLNGHWFWLVPADDFAEEAIRKCLPTEIDAARKGEGEV